MFVITSMPFGGAETLLVNLIRQLDRTCFAPELCCLKELGPLGAQLNGEIPTSSHLLRHKYDIRVVPRLIALMKRRRIDAVVTVGAGDKMFWGRLAACAAEVPVVVSALHSTGWPDSVGRLNRMLTCITDAFVGVADTHGRHLVQQDGFPEQKVVVIPNGVDVKRFAPRSDGARSECARSECASLRHDLGIPPDAPLVGMVAALRPEKNHPLLLNSAQRVLQRVPAAQFVVVGDGPERQRLMEMAAELQIFDSVHFIGSRPDIPELLAIFDVFALSSHIEANPVSILEAMATGLPVVATRVGSVSDVVRDGQTGYLVAPDASQQMADQLITLLTDRQRARKAGVASRQEVVKNWSLEHMVHGYEALISQLHASKRPRFTLARRRDTMLNRLAPILQ